MAAPRRWSAGQRDRPDHDRARWRRLAAGQLPLDAVAVASDQGGVALFAVNRDQTTPVVPDVDLRSLPSLSAASHVARSRATIRTQ